MAAKTETASQDQTYYEQRRSEILTAACDCFTEAGFTATTMVDIAKRVGMSAGNLYNYFKGKDDIVEELSKVELQNFLAEVTQIASYSEEERHAKLKQVALKRMDSGASRVRLEILNEMAHNKHIERVVQQFDATWRTELLKHQLAHGRTLEEAQTNVDFCMALMDGLSLRVQMNPGLDRERIAELVAQTIHCHS